MPESKSVAQKLGVKDGSVVRLIGADADLASLIEPLPEGAVVSVSQPPDVCVIFVTDAADLRERLATELAALVGTRAVWIAYRKGNVVDLNRNTIMAESQNAAWDTVANVAMGEIWSAVRIKPMPST